jgi:hypothetical protein
VRAGGGVRKSYLGWLLVVAGMGGLLAGIDYGIIAGALLIDGMQARLPAGTLKIFALKDIEHNPDDLAGSTHELNLKDIFALSRAVDDILDYAYSTVDEMTVLCVSPNDHLRRMVSLLRDAAVEVHMAMKQLKAHPRVATDHAQRAKALENRVESVYREAIAALFAGSATPEKIVEMLKLREIYRHLSNAADRGDEAANIISDIVVKMT